MKSKILLFFFLPLIAISQTQLGENLTNPDENHVKPSGFGTGIAITPNGSTIAVGAPGNNEDSFVRVFEYKNSTWKQIGGDIVNESVLEKVGFSVSLSSDGKILAVGTPNGGDLDEGHVRIYEFKNNNWEKTGQIVGDGTQFHLGYKVILSPDAKFLAATAYITNSSKKGTVKVYENISGIWTQRGSNLEGEFNYDAFGIDIDLSDDGTTLGIVNKGRKKAKVFKFENNDWTQIGSDFSNLKIGTRQGLSLSLSSDGNKVAIGSTGVSIYENNQGTWNLIGSKIAYGSYSSLSSDGTKITIGDPNFSKVRNYIFENGSWSQRGNEIEIWRRSRLGGIITLSSDGETVFAFPVVYSFNPNLLSTERILSEKEITIFPNPAKNSFQIEFSNNLKLKEMILYNAIGKKVLVSTSSSIDISTFSKGIYYAKIISNKGFITKKIIKN